MLVRLGNVLYWAATAAAILLFACAAYAAFGIEHGDHLVLAAMVAVVGLLVWLAGRAILYVLAGR